jgi:hypothetical protein
VKVRCGKFWLSREPEGSYDKALAAMDVWYDAGGQDAMLKSRRWGRHRRSRHEDGPAAGFAAVAGEAEGRAPCQWTPPPPRVSPANRTFVSARLRARRRQGNSERNELMQGTRHTACGMGDSVRGMTKAGNDRNDRVCTGGGRCAPLCTMTLRSRSTCWSGW